MDIIIRGKVGVWLYGHQFNQRLMETGQKHLDVLTVDWLDPSAYVAWVGARFSQFAEVRALVAADKPSKELLEAVSDRIELTREDVEDLLQRQIPGDAQTELRADNQSQGRRR
jgi:hypothetical protein